MPSGNVAGVLVGTPGPVIGKKLQLAWPDRVRIGLELAMALSFLHSSGTLPGGRTEMLTHRQGSASNNILADAPNNAAGRTPDGS